MADDEFKNGDRKRDSICQIIGTVEVQKIIDE